MCGICGFVGTDLNGNTVQRMVTTLNHRGPDGSGFWTGTGGALGHTRLAIIDLTEAAKQPMTTQDGRYVIVFNGEVYNYQELRHELEQNGESFQSSSDTEVVLIGYRKWGRETLHRLRGMFAFAIWDTQHQQLFLARDRIGIKPLFYTPLAGALVFASEIKSMLMHARLSREINPAAVNSYLTLGYIPGPDTIFRDIHALSPGYCLEWHNGRLRTHQYWAPDFTSEPLGASEDDLVEEFDQRLNDAVKAHLVADVPVGAFLSGGVDSSLVTAIAQRNSPEPLRTYTIGFAEGADERHFARTVATHINSHHQERLATPELVEDLPLLVWHLEQPLFDNSVLPTFLVSKFAKEQVKVVLSGDGGDEPFAGYDWTRFALNLPNLPITWDTSGWQWAYRSGLRGLLRRLLYDLGHGGDSRYLRRTTVPQSLTHWLYTTEFSELLGEDVDESLSVALGNAPIRDRRDRFLYTDLRIYLPEDVLFKVDRMSMANGLEVRVPLLDHQLLEWILRLPFSMRYRHGRGKHLLRKVAARYLPSFILKPRKQGFTIPIARWLYGGLGQLVEALFSSKAFRERDIVRPEAAMALLSMHRSKRYDLGHRIWSLVILEIWARVWLDGQQLSGALSDELQYSRTK